MSFLRSNIERILPSYNEAKILYFGLLKSSISKKTMLDQSVIKLLSKMIQNGLEGEGKSVKKEVCFTQVDYEP